VGASNVKPGQIRPIAVAVFRDDNRIFVAQYRDPRSGVTFYRPIGGAIDFGERGSECVAREMREELGTEIKDLT